MKAVLEGHVEQAMLEWLAGLGWSVAHGPDISPPDAKTPGTERDSYREVALRHRLTDAIARLNPHIPAGARDDALRRVLSPNVPALVSANRQLHRWLVDGVPVEFQKDGETRGDRVRLLDFADVSANDWVAVNQFSVQGPKLTRRPDVVLFVNGLPLVVVGAEKPRRRGSGHLGGLQPVAGLQAGHPRPVSHQRPAGDFRRHPGPHGLADQRPRAVHGLAHHRRRRPPTRWGRCSELETLVQGLFQRELLLDYLRHFILFEDDGQLVKKVAGYHQFHAVRAVVQSVLQASAPGGTRKGGVVWHTQGAGKSIEMTCLAGAPDGPPRDGQPDLGGGDRPQRPGQPALRRLRRRQRTAARNAGTGRHTARSCASCWPTGRRAASSSRLSRSSRQARTRTRSRYSRTARNIVVICDEAHRSQYGFRARS